MEIGTVKECSVTKMVENMKGNSIKEHFMEKEEWYTQIILCMTESGKEGKKVVMVNTNIKMVMNILVNGLKIKSQEKER